MDQQHRRIVLFAKGSIVNVTVLPVIIGTAGFCVCICNGSRINDAIDHFEKTYRK